MDTLQNLDRHIHSVHATSWVFGYGTALLSRIPFVEVLYHTFRASPPTMNKGFSLGQIAWQAEAGANQRKLIDVISVHMDFARKSVREAQIREMRRVLSERPYSRIILGDFD